MVVFLSKAYTIFDGDFALTKDSISLISNIFSNFKFILKMTPARYIINSDAQNDKYFLRLLCSLIAR